MGVGVCLYLPPRLNLYMCITFLSTVQMVIVLQQCALSIIVVVKRHNLNNTPIVLGGQLENLLASVTSYLFIYLLCVVID